MNGEDGWHACSDPGYMVFPRLRWFMSLGPLEDLGGWFGPRLFGGFFTGCAVFKLSLPVPLMHLKLKHPLELTAGTMIWIFG